MADSFNDLLKASIGGEVHVPSASGGTTPKKKKPKTFTQISTITEAGDSDPDLEKSDWTLPLTITKMAPDQRLVFGWASVASVGDKVIVDKHNDIIPVEELEKAAYEFCLNYREQDDMHTAKATGRCVECMVFTPEKAALGIFAKSATGENIYGLWTGFYVEDDSLWKAHLEGKRPQFSIGGSARKEQV